LGTTIIRKLFSWMSQKRGNSFLENKNAQFGDCHK